MSAFPLVSCDAGGVILPRSRIRFRADGVVGAEAFEPVAAR
jgi:hypothetical protein